MYCFKLVILIAFDWILIAVSSAHASHPTVTWLAGLVSAKAQENSPTGKLLLASLTRESASFFQSRSSSQTRSSASYWLDAMEAPSVLEAMAIDTTLDTFRALVSTHEALDRDEARLVTSMLLERCTQGHLIDNKRDVLTIALALLEHKTQNDNDFATLLLRLVCALKQRTRWPSDVSYEVAEVFVKLLTRPSIRGSSVELVLQFVREIVQETPALEPEIQLAFAKFMMMAHCRVSIWRWRRFKVWELGADLPNACGILRAGSAREKLLILKCLLASSQATQESFMVSNDGAELTLIVCTRGSSPAVKELALEFVKDVAIHIPACRAHIINLWMTDTTKFEHLDSGVFLEALVLDEISESLASSSSGGKLGNDHMFEAHALDWGQELVIDEGNGSAPQPFGDYPLPAIMNIDDKLEELRNLKGGRSATPSSVGSLLLKAVHTGSESEVLMELDLLVRWDEGLVVYLCTSLDLLEVFATRLSRPDTSFRVKSDLWNILLGLLNRNFQATPHLVVGIRAVAVMALDALVTRGNAEAELFQMFALRGLRSPLLSSEENRKAVVELGAIPILVKLLAEQEIETPRGRELIVTLREFAVGAYLGRAHEIDQVVASLCDQQNSSLRENPEAVVPYYQNLILLYHDIPGVRLGRLEGIDKVISAAAIMELLRNVRDLEKVLVMKYFHNELELHVSDPLYGVSARPELSAVVDVLCEKLEDVILVAIKAPAEVKKVARRILTAVAASNKASHEKLRVYQRLYRPEPALVLRGLLVEDCDEDMRQPEDGEEQREKEDEYQYSDCDEEERGIGHTLTGEECEIDQEDCAQRDSDLGAYQVDGNDSIREKLAAVSLADDWEML